MNAHAVSRTCSIISTESSRASDDHDAAVGPSSQSTQSKLAAEAVRTASQSSITIGSIHNSNVSLTLSYSSLPNNITTIASQLHSDFLNIGVIEHLPAPLPIAVISQSSNRCSSDSPVYKRTRVNSPNDTQSDTNCEADDECESVNVSELQCAVEPFTVWPNETRHQNAQYEFNNCAHRMDIPTCNSGPSQQCSTITRIVLKPRSRTRQHRTHYVIRMEECVKCGEQKRCGSRPCAPVGREQCASCKSHKCNRAGALRRNCLGTPCRSLKCLAQQQSNESTESD